MDERTTGRRGFLRGAAGAGAVGAGIAAGAGTAVAQAFDGWFEGVDNYDGLVDRTGQDSVTIEVGVDNGGSPVGFGPAAVRVDPGTEVTFEWVSNTHSILMESAPEGTSWSDVSDIHNSGYTTSHTFETAGVYKYYCEPHRSMGMKGAIVVGDAEISSGGHGGGGSLLDQPDSLLTLGGFISLGVLSPLLFYLFLRRKARRGDI
ncbi:MAG: halocyanin domain-containing protein [Halobacteriaceae archaeon]